MSYTTIRYERADGVATIRLDRPTRLNALTAELLGELSAALDRAVEEGARAILLTGEGRAFCSGADLAGLPDDLGVFLEDNYNPVARKFAALPIPVVTAINGAAAGAGCALALMGDIVVMAESAYLLLAFVNIGLVPDFGATWLVAKAAGRMKALEMMMLGEKIPAGTALAWGLVTRTVGDADLQSEAAALAQRLANGPTRAMGMIRQAASIALSGSLDDVLTIEAANQREAGRTADAREAIAAFAEKRKPSFVGS